MIEAIMERITTHKYPLKTAALWAISHPGRGHCGHLFGTVHKCIPAKALRSDVKDAFKRSEIIFFEVEMDSPDRMELSDLLGEHAHLPEGQDLETLLGEEYWEKLIDIAGEGGRITPEDLEILREFQPWMVANAIGMALCVFDIPKGKMDSGLLKRARERGADVRFLESLEFSEQSTVEMLTSMPIKHIKRLIDNPEQALIAEFGLVDLYQRGEWDQISSSLQGDYAYEPVVVERNMMWMPKVLEALEEGTVLVAAGVGHMLGPDSLVVHLEAAGYAVTAVRTMGLTGLAATAAGSES